MKITICPKCGSDDIILDSAGQTGKYKCKNCSYLGPLVIEKEEEIAEKKISMFYPVVFIVGVLVILFLILFGIKLLAPPTLDDMTKEIIEKGSTENGYLYNGFVFIKQEGLWHTKLQRGDVLYNLHFHYSPAEVDVSVPVSGGLREGLDTSKVYITFDPLEENTSLIGVAMSELGLNLVKGLGTKITPACYRNETEGCYDRPIITCNNTDEAVMWVRSASSTEVLIYDNCIVMQGPGEDVFKAVDKVLFNLYGIVEYKD